MSVNLTQDWIGNLEQSELTLIKRFLLNSGSLKMLAKEYGVTYPTIRLRLDRVIDKIKQTDKEVSLPYVSLIKNLAFEEKIDFETAKVLIEVYLSQRREDENI